MHRFELGPRMAVTGAGALVMSSGVAVLPQ
jgi:hypothetical protein